MAVTSPSRRTGYGRVRCTVVKDTYLNCLLAWAAIISVMYGKLCLTPLCACTPLCNDSLSIRAAVFVYSIWKWALLCLTYYSECAGTVMPALQGLTLPFLFGEGKDQKIYGSMQLNFFETTTLLLYIYVKHCNRSCLL